MTTLTDSRTLTLVDAKSILEQLAHGDCRIAAEVARAERRYLVALYPRENAPTTR